MLLVLLFILWYLTSSILSIFSWLYVFISQPDNFGAEKFIDLYTWISAIFLFGLIFLEYYVLVYLLGLYFLILLYATIYVLSTITEFTPDYILNKHILDIIISVIFILYALYVKSQINKKSNYLIIS